MAPYLHPEALSQADTVLLCRLSMANLRSVIQRAKICAIAHGA